MKLLTAGIIKRLPKLGATDGLPAKDRKVICKFFSPYSGWTWWVLEFDGEDTLFCYVKGFEAEYGYASLQELQETKWHGVQAVERDLYYGDHTLQEVLDGVSAAQ